MKRIINTLFFCLIFSSVSAQIFDSPVIRTRGSISNSYNTFSNKKSGRVAFVGGSITHMKGWVDLVEQNLKMRFPDTKFEFLNAGIPSIGSVPDAFRLDNDVLSKGDFDLIFVEAAVNDDTNESSLAAPLKGMEGIVRHILNNNPNTDIIMLDFIYEPYIEMLSKGKEPDVILSHERVANYYMIPSIRLDLDIYRRLVRKEFTWEQFGGTHPKPFGQRYYFSAIKRLFDSMWIQLSDKKSISHYIPKKTLDSGSYYGGKFIDIHSLKIPSGWKIEENWKAPELKSDDSELGNLNNSGDYIRVKVREGFSEVPMLESLQPGKKLKFSFLGNAVGIFCVAGPNAGIIRYRVDAGEWKDLDTFTEWSSQLYIPWLYVLSDGLSNAEHILELYMLNRHNKLSNGNTIQIRQFVVNGI